jgi:hypothetical protein
LLRHRRIRRLADSGVEAGSCPARVGWMGMDWIFKDSVKQDDCPEIRVKIIISKSYDSKFHVQVAAVSRPQ